MSIKEQFRKISVGRIFVLTIIMLLLVNNIKIPPEDVPIIHVPSLDAIATATPFFILSREDLISGYALAHERCHIAQYNRYGSVWTVAINTYYQSKYDYLDNPFERQAFNFTGFCKQYKYTR